MQRILRKIAFAGTLIAMSGAAHAATNVVWWDFLSGGDGVRMKAMIAEFNKENPDIHIDATTLEWGTRFYTKVQTAAAVGQGPDVMTYHLSRLPLGVQTGVLRPFTADELASVGLKASDYAPHAWQSAHYDGKLYAVPLDIHSIVLYYNKDLLKKAGLLGPDGLPKGFDGIANFDAALQKLTGSNGAQYGVSIATADAGQGATNWRVFYTLFSQMGGTFITNGKVLTGDNLDKAVKAESVIANWVAKGWAPKQTAYPASIALFTAGKAAMMINGVWEVPTMVDLATQKKLGFDWGAVQIPAFYGHAGTWADSHAFAIPARKGNPVSKEKVAAVMKVIAWMNKHSIMWAAGGHVPAYLPVTQSAAYREMQPNATYSSYTKTAIYDPRSKIAGVASPIYEANANYLQAATNGQLSPKDAIEQMRDELQGDLD